MPTKIDPETLDVFTKAFEEDKETFQRKLVEALEKSYAESLEEEDDNENKE